MSVWDQKRNSRCTFRAYLHRVLFSCVHNSHGKVSPNGQRLFQFSVFCSGPPEYFRTHQQNPTDLHNELRFGWAAAAPLRRRDGDGFRLFHHLFFLLLFLLILGQILGLRFLIFILLLQHLEEPESWREDHLLKTKREAHRLAALAPSQNHGMFLPTKSGGSAPHLLLDELLLLLQLGRVELEHSGLLLLHLDLRLRRPVV